MIRPTPIRRYLEVMNAKGFAAEKVVLGSGIDVSALEDAKYLIDVGQYRRVVENMIALSGGEALGLDVGLQRDVKDYGILGYAALSCRSVRQSVEEFWGQYGDALGMMAKIAVPRGSSDQIAVDIVAASMSALAYRFFVEEALCLLLKVGGQVAGVEPRFVELQLGYPAPRYAQRYREIFRCPVSFSARRTRATLGRSWFEMPLKTSDPELIKLYKQHLLNLQREIEASNPLQIRLNRLLVRCGTRIPMLEEAARELGLSTRTLKRQLQQQGRSYRGLVSAYRAERAFDMLKSGKSSAKLVSEQTGFKDVNALRRAFKRWTGATMSEFRSKSRK